MNKFALATALAAASLAMTGTANASVSVSVQKGTTNYTGPITYDFSSSIPSHVDGGGIVAGTTSGSYAQPVGSDGPYYSVGPSTDNPGTIYFDAANVFNVSFIWGSIDTYNTLTFVDALGNSLGLGYTFTGSQIAALVPALANGDQASLQTNPIVTFFFDGADPGLVAGMRLSSDTNAFEIDDVAVNGVPEPATWAMMILGFGAIGFAMRRRRVSATALPQLA